MGITICYSGKTRLTDWFQDISGGHTSLPRNLVWLLLCCITSLLPNKALQLFRIVVWFSLDRRLCSGPWMQQRVLLGEHEFLLTATRRVLQFVTSQKGTICLETYLTWKVGLRFVKSERTKVHIYVRFAHNIAKTLLHPLLKMQIGFFDLVIFWKKMRKCCFPRNERLFWFQNLSGVFCLFTMPVFKKLPSTFVSGHMKLVSCFL